MRHLLKISTAILLLVSVLPAQDKTTPTNIPAGILQPPFYVGDAQAAIVGGVLTQRPLRQAAILFRICQRVVPESHRCHGGHDGEFGSALSGKVSREWNCFKHA